MNIKPIEVDRPANIEIEKLIKQLEEQCRSGFALGIVKDGQVLTKHFYGFADIAHKVEVDQNTKFPIASISKIYTGSLVHHIAGKGLIDLEKPANHYLPELEEAGKASVKSLLTMTSGLSCAFELFMLSGASNLVTHSLEEHFLAEQVFCKEDQGYKGNFIYSNSAYIFLAEILARVTGKTYEQLLKEVVLDPLGLSQTDYFDGNWRVVDNMAVPDVYEDGHHTGRFYRNMAGAGHLAATLDDMMVFAEALAMGKAAGVPVNTLAQKDKVKNGDPSFYGSGLQIIPVNERRQLIGHNGKYHGISTILLHEPHSKTSFVLLSNDNAIDTSLWGVDFISAASGQELSLIPKKEKETSSTVLQYISAETGLFVELNKDEGFSEIKLYGSSYPLIKIAENKYMRPYSVAPIFVTEKSETELIVSIGGIDHAVVVIDSFEDAPANMMEYVGSYKNPNSDIEQHVKFIRGGKLNIQFGNAFSAIEDATLKPLAKDYFECTIEEHNGSNMTVYLKFEREQFSQMISGYTVHSMRLPKLSFRRLKTV